MKLYGSDKLSIRGVTARLLPCNHSFNTSIYHSFPEESSITELYNERILYLLNSQAKAASAGQQHQITLDSPAMKEFEDFAEECRWNFTDNDYIKQWYSKLPGNACRLALSAHIWNNPENFTEQPITGQEMHLGRFLMERLAESATFLFSPLGLTAQIHAKKIIASWHRIQGDINRSNFIRYGTDSTQIQQRTRLNRQEVNNALYRLANNRIVAIADNGTGNLQVRLHYDFFDMPLL